MSRESDLGRWSDARLIRGFSHDVKNPLGAAEGNAALLTSGNTNARQFHPLGYRPEDLAHLHERGEVPGQPDAALRPRPIRRPAEPAACRAVSFAGRRRGNLARRSGCYRTNRRRRSDGDSASPLAGGRFTIPSGVDPYRARARYAGGLIANGGHHGIRRDSGPPRRTD